MEADKERIRAIWRQTEIPVVFRRTGLGQVLRVRLPEAADNRSWLKNGRRRHPIWIQSKEYWELPKAWLNDFVHRSLKRYGRVYLIQPYREKQICAPSCMKAAGHECECSCMGANHGMQNDGSWHEISDAFAVRWGDAHMACRLLVLRKGRRFSVQ